MVAGDIVVAAAVDVVVAAAVAEPGVDGEGDVVAAVVAEVCGAAAAVDVVAAAGGVVVTGALVLAVSIDTKFNNILVKNLVHCMLKKKKRNW